MKFFTYFIPTGEFLCGAELVGEGYAGRGIGLNNPALTMLRAVDHEKDDAGPLPAGWYTIVLEPSKKFGPPAFRLTPNPRNQMHGRDGFWMHGRRTLTDRAASTGCIVQDHVQRVRVGQLVDEKVDYLWVTAASWVPNADRSQLGLVDLGDVVLGRVIASPGGFRAFYGAGMGEELLTERPSIPAAQAALVERVAETTQ